MSDKLWFTESVWTEDAAGKTSRFFVGQKVRIRNESCPQIDGVVDTVRACFFQDQTLGERGFAVLLDGHSWEYCKNLEIV